jgi:hypothetical protein
MPTAITPETYPTVISITLLWSFEFEKRGTGTP